MNREGYDSDVSRIERIFDIEFEKWGEREKKNLTSKNVLFKTSLLRII